MAALTPPVSISLENEENPWLATAARFDEKAMRLKLDDGTCKVLRTPAREITVNIPAQLDDGRLEVFHRLPGATLHRARPGQRLRDKGNSRPIRFLIRHFRFCLLPPPAPRRSPSR